MKIKLATLFALIISIKFSYANDGVGMRAFIGGAFNQKIGYQIGYSSTNNHLLQAVEFTGAIMFVNYAYQYQMGFSSKVFVGLGFGDIVQLQYGYIFDTNYKLLRIRSDWRLFDISSKYCSIYMYHSTIGVFIEKGLGNNYYSIGTALSLSLWDVEHYAKKWLDKKK